jgi:hypothetical protein
MLISIQPPENPEGRIRFPYENVSRQEVLDFIVYVTKLAYLRFYYVTKIISETETVSFKLCQTKLISVYLFFLITVTIQYISMRS